MNTDPAERLATLKRYTTSDTIIAELLAYNDHPFDHSQLPDDLVLPLPDESFVATWETYLQESRGQDLFAYLREKLVQLRFPISEGISERESYRTVTLKGGDPAAFDDAVGLTLQAPDLLRAELHQTPAGRIPIIITAHREDFVTLVRALAMRNEPKPVPDSMGACIIRGYNNWDRIDAMRQAWQQSAPETSDAAWRMAFRRMSAEKDRYQDRFIILSDAAYSGVPAEQMDLQEDKWRDLSLIIRRDHECAHYATVRFFGSMRNNLLDEIIADYMGVVAATGHYRADWFLQFMGLENFPAYRAGGRLENYRGTPPLSDKAFDIVKQLVIDASHNLEVFHQQTFNQLLDTSQQALVLLTLTAFTLEGLADSDAVMYLKKTYETLCERY